MSLETGHTERQEQRARVGLVAGAVLCLVASGGLLWWRYGGAVFNDLVLTTLSCCCRSITASSALLPGEACGS